MIEFNKLIIIPYNKGLYIDCQIMDMPYFEDVYLDKIIIDTQDTYTSSGPSKVPVYSKTIEGNTKSIQLTVPDTELLVSPNETIFFVYVTAKGTPKPETPCGLDMTVAMAACVDSYSIYRIALNYLSEAYESCSIPKHLIDFILRYKAFQISLKTRDFPLAISYWKKFVSSNISKQFNQCNCYGRISI